MKTFHDCVQKQAKRMFNEYMSGSMFYSVDNSMISFIFELDIRYVDITVQQEFEKLREIHYEQLQKQKKAR